MIETVHVVLYFSW